MAKEKSNFGLSEKRSKIEQSRTRVVVFISLAVAVLIFTIFAAQSLIKQIQYNNKVLSLRNQAVAQLEQNIDQANQLAVSFEAFDNAQESVIGNATKNSTIILNALPSKYDLPALVTSLESVINSSGASISSITGNDEEVTAEQSSLNPEPKEIPFTISAKGSYAAIQSLVFNLERSTRPIVVKEISFKGSDNDLEATISAVTYYQPVKKLDLDKKTVQGSSQTTDITDSTGGISE